MYPNAIPERRNLIAITVAFCLTLLATTLIASSAIGQDNYKSDKIAAAYVIPEVPELGTKTEKSQARRKASEIKKKITNSRKAAIASLEGSINKSAIEPYVNGYVLPKMTQTDDDTLSQLGEIRADFIDDYLSKDVSPTNRRYFINTVVLPFARKVVPEDYHPAVRLNAVLLVGMINEVDPDRNQLPRPSMDCINYLLQLANNANTPEFIKVGAITGIHRNAMIDSLLPTPRIDSAVRTQIGALALSITNNSANGQDTWSPETNYWLRRRAVQSLGYLKTAGNNDERANAVLDVLSKADEKMWLRFDAMVALGEMDLSSAVADTATDKITLYVADSLKAEAVSLESNLTELVAINLLYGSEDLLKTGTKKKKEKFQRGTGMSADESLGGSTDGSDAKNQGPKIDLPAYKTNDTRRRIKSLTFYAAKVLTTLKAKASPAKDQTIADAIDRINETLADADVGLTDLGADEPEDDLADEEPAKAVADQMNELFTKASADLERLIKGEPEDEIGLN